MDKCMVCNRAMAHATRENLDGLLWLDGHEQWICNSCFNSKSRQISVIPEIYPVIELKKYPMKNNAK
jgi:hypothetical protein